MKPIRSTSSEPIENNEDHGHLPQPDQQHEQAAQQREGQEHFPQPIQHHERGMQALVSATMAPVRQNMTAPMVLQWGRVPHFVSMNQEFAPPQPAAAAAAAASPISQPQSLSPQRPSVPSPSPPLPSEMPLPPGYAVTLPDPETGRDRRYRVEYNCYSVPRKHLPQFMKAYMSQVHNQRQPVARGNNAWGTQRLHPPQSPPQPPPLSRGDIPENAIAATPAFGPMPMGPLPWSLQQSPAPPPMDLPPGWGWSWQNGMWVMWKDPNERDGGSRKGEGT